MFLEIANIDKKYNNNTKISEKLKKIPLIIKTKGKKHKTMIKKTIFLALFL